MDNVTSSDLNESKKALVSAIQKSKKALAQMTKKGANTQLLTKRLKVLSTSLEILAMNGQTPSDLYSFGELRDIREGLVDLLISIKRINENLRLGSSQKTLLEKRISAMNLVIQMIDENQ